MKATSTGMQCIRFFRKIWERRISVQRLFQSHSRGTLSQTVKTSLWPGDYPPTYSPDLVTYDFVLP